MQYSCQLVNLLVEFWKQIGFQVGFKRMKIDCITFSKF